METGSNMASLDEGDERILEESSASIHLSQ
jgi:hypothetical protein